MNIVMCNLYYLLNFDGLFSPIGFVATSFGESPQSSIAVYRIIFQFGIGFNGLLALAIPTDVHLMVLSVMYLMSVPLHLIITCLSSVQSTLDGVLWGLHGYV